MPPAAPSTQRLASFDWASLTSLRLRAKAVVDGLYAGMHPSVRKGSGVEFGGHRAYVPGDDVKLLDRRAMARHDKPFVRELQTETERALRLLVDASGSMAFRGSGPVSKFDYAATIAAALGRIALSSGDPVGLEFVGGAETRSLPAASGRESFERLLSSLGQAKAEGDITRDLGAVDRALGPVARRARRGAVIVLISDLIDLHPEAVSRFAALGTGGRALVVLQVLDPDEATFPFEGPVKLRSIESPVEVETDPVAVKRAYLDALGALREGWSSRLLGQGGRLISCATGDDPVGVVRQLLRVTQGGGR